MPSKIYLIPTTLHEDEISLQTIPGYILQAIKDCHVFFAENEKTTRRYFKKLWKDIQINNYEWHAIHKAEQTVKQKFLQYISEQKNIGITSEAGCPAIADPGQLLVEEAQNANAEIIPIVGPSSILLALMASGMNGQKFQFNGYLPVGSFDRKKVIKQLEEYSAKNNCTQIFIETPYRNNQLAQDVISVCKTETRFCIASELTSANQKIQTKTIRNWQNNLPELHKKPVIFLLHAI